MFMRCCILFFIFYFYVIFIFIFSYYILYKNNNTRFTTMKLNNGLRNWINRCKEYAKANGCSYKVAMSKLGKKGTRRGSLRGGGVADHAEAFTPVAGSNPPSSPPHPQTAVDAATMGHKDAFTVGALPQAQTGGGLGMFEVGGAPQSLTGGRRRRHRRQQTGGRKKSGSKKRSSRRSRSRSRSHRGGSGSSSSLSYSDYS